MKFVQTDYVNNKGILKYPDHYIGETVMIDDTGVAANADGKKIVPAGSLIAYTVQADGSKLGTVKNDATVNGVLLVDCDVTYGKDAAAIVIHGFIDKAKLPVVPVAATIAALPLIKFM